MEKIFSKRSLFIFFFSFLPVFIVTSLHLLGISWHMISPLPHKAEKIDTFPILMPKLTRIKNEYRLKATSSLVSQAAAAGEYDQASAYGVIGFTAGQVIVQKNIDQKLPVASLTKIMSAVVTMDLVGENTLMPIYPPAAKTIPTKIGVIPGEKMTSGELVEASLMTSANDAAESLRQGIDHMFGAGTFVRAMNAKAEVIGLTHTHFANPQGFDESTNYSSVSDLAILSHYALTNYPYIAEVAAKDYAFLPATKYHKQFDLYNWNGLIDVYPDTVGLKIGNTDAAGYTTIVLSKRNNQQVLAIVLGAPGVLKRDEWAASLLDLGYQDTSGLAAVNVSEDALRAKYATWKYWN